MGRFMLDIHTGYEQQGKAAVLSPAVSQQLDIYAVHLLNRTAAAMDMGILIKLGPSGYKFGLLQGGTPVVDVTLALQSGTTEDVVTTTIGDGFLVQSTKTFGLIGLAVSQASTGSPVYSALYYNGTAYVPLPDIIEVADYSATGDKLLVFAAPRDWVKGSTPAVGGDSDKYSLQLITTTAPGQAVQANDVWAGHFLHFQENVAPSGLLSLTYAEKFCRILDSQEGLLPYFKVANPKNMVTAKYFSRD